MTSPAVGTGIVAFIEARRREHEFEPTRLSRPGYVLAQAAKDRAILALHQPDAEPAPSAGALHCAEDGHAYPCQTVRLLAAVDADHPAYRPEWKPVAT